MLMRTASLLRSFCLRRLSLKNSRLHTDVKDGILYRTAEISDIPQCHRLIRTSFYLQNLMYQHLGIDPNTVEDYPYVTEETFQQRLSMVAEADGGIIGLLVAQKEVPETLENRLNKAKGRQDSAVIELYETMDRGVDFFKLLNVNVRADIMIATVDDNYGNRGVGVNMLKASVQRMLQQDIPLAVGLADNYYALRGYHSVGFKKLFAINFNDYVDERGDRPLAGLNDSGNEEIVGLFKRLK